MPRWNKPKGSKESRYSVANKREVPMTLAEFLERMTKGNFVKKSHRAYAIGEYYFGLRKNEMRLAETTQFSIQGNYLVFDVGERLKHSSTTDPLRVALDAPFLNELIEQIRLSPEGRLFSFSSKTAYNVMRRAGFYYPHYTRLSRITNLFASGKTIAEVKSFTGLSLKALDFYVGKVGLTKIADSLGKED